MAVTAIEVLSLEDAKVQLSVEPSRTDLDGRIGSCIKAAVAMVQRQTGVPLVDYNKVVLLNPLKMGPVLIPYRHVRSIVTVAYWTPSQTIGADPTGAMDVGTLGRLTEGAASTLLYPPVVGWPDRLQGTPLQITAKLGMTIDERSEDLKFEVIIRMRHFFENPDQIGRHPPSRASPGLAHGS